MTPTAPAAPAPVLQGWAFDADTRILTVGQSVCGTCQYNREPVPAGRQQVFPWISCVPCKGTGKRGNGKCRKCDYYRASHTHNGSLGEYAPGLVPDHADPRDGGACPRCLGTRVVDSYDMAYGNARMPQDIKDAVVAAIPVVAIVSGQHLNRGEQIIGAMGGETEEFQFGTVYTVSDYGTTWALLVAAHEAGTAEQWLADYAVEQTPKVREMSRVIEVAKAVCAERYSRDPRHLIMERVVLVVRPNGVVAYSVFRKAPAA